MVVVAEGGEGECCSRAMVLVVEREVAQTQREALELHLKLMADA